jgi:hypothetical protein
VSEYSGFPEVPHEYPVSTREVPLDRSARSAIRSETKVEARDQSA